MTTQRLTAAQAHALVIALEETDTADTADEALADRLYKAATTGRTITISTADAARLLASIEADPAEWPARLWRSLDSALAKCEAI